MAVQAQARRKVDEQVAHDLGLEPEGLAKVGAGLAGVLSDTYLLYVKTQGFHWNVTGPQFGELHAMFEQQYVDLAAAVDELAERLRAIGQIAPGSFAQFKRMSKIGEEEDAPDSDRMIEVLTEDHGHVIRRMREVLELAEPLGDAETADMMIRRMQVHGKQAWMLRSHLK